MEMSAHVVVLHPVEIIVVGLVVVHNLEETVAAIQPKAKYVV